MKKSKAMRLASGLLVLAILTTCALSATFAKYTSTGKGTASAQVAKWSFTVNTEDITKESAQQISFNLLDSRKDTDGTQNETDVTNGKIAPGTSGEFAFTLKNNSEVNADYAITLMAQNENSIPLQYCIEGEDNLTWYTSISELNQSLKGRLNSNDTEKTVTIMWCWAFDDKTTSPAKPATQTDVTDTALGVAAQTAATVPTVTITATVTATQVD